MIRLLRMLAVLIGLAFAVPAQADELRPGYLELVQRDAQHWQMVWKAPLLGNLASKARPVLPPFCTAKLDAPRLEGGALLAMAALTCTRPLDGAQIGLTGLDASYTDALVRIAPLERPVQAERLTAARPVITVSSIPDRWQVARTYFELGVEHILTGYDHLLFVIALVLLIGRGVPVIKAATAFTVAHSVTLAGTALGLFGLAQRPVEVLIALSIVFLAVEITKQDPARPRLSERIPWIVAFGFGLLHGFGFAGALREIGMPQGEVPMALLTFNLGVEAGQLVIIAVCLGSLALIRRAAPALLRPALTIGSYCIGVTASFWVIARLVS